MPFDAMIATKPCLTQVLNDAGITPVPWKVLTDHKAAQVRRHRQSIFLTPIPYALCGMAAGAWMLVPFLETLDPSMFLPAMLLAMVGMFIGMIGSFTAIAVLTISFDIKFRSKARWVEHLILWDITGIPQPIADVVNRLNTPSNRWQTELVYGELIRNRVTLDPYILIEVHGEYACLGIWDGDQVIACAQ